MVSNSLRLTQAVYRSLLHLSWVDKLVDNLKTIFVDLYRDEIKRPHMTVVSCRGFDEYFDQQYKELEGNATNKPHQPADTASFLEEKTTSGNFGDEPPLPPGLKQRANKQNGSLEPPSPNNSTPNTSRPTTPAGGANHLVVGKTGPIGSKMSRRARKMQHANSAPASSGDEGSLKKGKKPPKKGRKWDADGFADEEDDVQLDYSGTQNANPPASDSEAEGARPSGVESVDAKSWGTTTSKGQFVLRDLDDEVHSILKSAEAKNAAAAAKSEQEQQQRGGLVGSGLSTIGGLFRNVIGGKTLTKADLEKAMKGMEDHLLKKNVAREAAIRLCEGVERELVGVKTGSFESTDARIATAMEAALTKMLTPTSSLDLLREIDAVTRPAPASGHTARPYVISIVGVNGVGKSTNLSKICYFLLQNKYRVLVAAGDTFRSGAVEQLKVHVRNLQELTEREGGRVELFEKGYGGDAAAVAKDAVREAAHEGYDVVLIDTAGRRHNDQRLMSSLEKFAKFAQPDKILMVGEVSALLNFRERPRRRKIDANNAQNARPWWVRTRWRRRGTSTRRSGRAGAWMGSSSRSATRWATWWARSSASSTPPASPSSSSASASTTPTSATSPSAGPSRSCWLAVVEGGAGGENEDEDWWD